MNIDLANYRVEEDNDMDSVNEHMHRISETLNENDDPHEKRAIWSLIAGFLAVVEVMLEIRTLNVFQKVASMVEILMDYVKVERERFHI